mmetsp:Transcript_49198/g.96201  ORF Transcript_49198/g.96201 Transcript_49198/m.96201 type:complete len:323 (+) Transcript_49198:119-1087(+)
MIMSQLIRSLMKFVALTLIFTVIVDGVLHGSYVESEEFSMSPFRGATMSGGGSGIILFRDGDEAVVLTVAHGYDLTSMDAQESMDRKLQNDGGLRLATGEINGLATSAGGEQIIEENLGLFRHFTFWDPETCPAMNDGVTPPHTGKLNDPYACNGLGPDIDVALQRVRLTAAARTLSFPEIEIGLDPLSPGEALTLVGFGRKFPCDWPGMTFNGNGTRTQATRSRLQRAEYVLSSMERCSPKANPPRPMRESSVVQRNRLRLRAAKLWAPFPRMRTSGRAGDRAARETLAGLGSFRPRVGASLRWESTGRRPRGRRKMVVGT